MLDRVEIVSLGYRTDLMIHRLEGSVVRDDGDTLVVHSPGQPDYWWGNFLLVRGAAWTGEANVWLARFASAFPEAAHVAIGVDVADPSAVDPAGLLSAGFSVDRNTVLTAGALQSPRHLNEEVNVRPLAGDADWRQSAELRIACQEPGQPAGPAHEEFLRSRTARARALTESGHAAWLGAFHRGRLMAQAGVVWGRGEVVRYQDVETHPDVRRQGLAGTVVYRAGLHAMRKAGARVLVIVADPAGPAIGLYRSLGFRDTEGQVGFTRAPTSV